MLIQILLTIFIYTSKVCGIYHVQTPAKEECSCFCPEIASEDVSVCQKLSRFEKELSTVKDAVEYRTRYINEINALKEKLEWQEYFVETLSKKVESLSIVIPEKVNSMKPEPLIMKPEDQMQKDGNGRDTRLVNDGGNLVKDVSSLMTKVETVENMTIEVQEELKSERRVRRHIEEDLNEARTSIKILGDKFLNLSLPIEDRVAQVEDIIIANLENMNKTLFEDHLQKLYYKVEGVVYKNETRKLDERLDSLETELHSEQNRSVIEQVSEDLKILTDSLSVLNGTIVNQFKSDDQRLKKLEIKASKLEELDTLLSNATVLWNVSKIMQNGLIDLWNDVYDIKNQTSQLPEDIAMRVVQVVNETVDSVVTVLQNVTLDITILKEKLHSTQTVLNSVVKDVQDLAEEVSVNGFLYDSNIKGINEKIDNVTENLTKELNLRIQNLIEKKGKVLDDIKINQDLLDLSASNEDMEEYISNDNKVENDEEKDIVINFKKVDELCSVPVHDDTHLLITMKTDGNNKQRLEFACNPIRQYTLNETSEPMRCERGEWIGSLPSCERLLTEEEIEAEKLKDLIPTIDIDPDKVNKTNGLMGVDSTGQLIVYPGVSFKLHCLYPENRFGTPRWNKNSHPYPFLAGVPPKNRVTVSLTHPKEEDSGVYTCVSPFAKQTTIAVVIKAISCPVFDSDTPHGKNAFYRPHPEGMERVITTEAQFFCEGKQTLSAMCLADGVWSRTPPTTEECALPKYLRSEMPWNCEDIDTSQNPDLRLNPQNSGRIVFFKCPGTKKLRGSPFTRCTADGVWSHTKLPDCEPLA